MNYVVICDFKYKLSERRILTKMKKCNNCQIEYGEDIMYCEQCGSKLTFSEVSSNKEGNSGQDVPKKPKSRIGLILLCIFEAVLLVIAIIVCINLAIDRDYQQEQKINYSIKYNDIKDEYHKHAVIVIARKTSTGYKNYDGYYHKFGCKEISDNRFWIYNTETAKNNYHYNPCPNAHVR